MTNLLGDPLPKPLPMNAHLTQWSQLVGHTVKAVIDAPCGKELCDALIITDGNCWLALEAESNSTGEGTLEIIGRGYSTAPRFISDYASATELFEVGAVSQSEFAILDSAEKARKAKNTADQVARLRAQAARLELEVSNDRI